MAHFTGNFPGWQVIPPLFQIGPYDPVLKLTGTHNFVTENELVHRPRAGGGGGTQLLRGADNLSYMGRGIFFY